MKKKKIKKKKVVIFLLMIIFFILMIYSLIKIINYYKDNKKTKKLEETIKESIKVVKEENNSSDKKNEQEVETYEVDFESLKNINKNVVAYIKVPGTNIDYVVVKGKDNSYYLNHDLNNEYNVLGSIFADYRNKFDNLDKNIIVYGHDVKTGSMFGTLKNVLNSSWRENPDNQKIVFITESGNYLYQVFSTYTIDPEDYYIETNFKNDEDYQNFLNKLKYRSNYNYSVEISSKDSILTLSSCTNGGTKRIVLHAKKIDM